MSFLGFFNVYALRVNLSVALVAMVNQTEGSNSSVSDECPASDTNSTTVQVFQFESFHLNLLVRSKIFVENYV